MKENRTSGEKREEVKRRIERWKTTVERAHSKTT